MLDREGVDCAPSPRWGPDLAHRVAHQCVMSHRHGEHLREHAARDSGGAAAEVHSGQCLIDHTRPGLGQPQATQARVDDPRQRVLVPGQGLQRHHAAVLTPPLPGRQEPEPPRRRRRIQYSPSSCTVMSGSAPRKPRGRLCASRSSSASLGLAAPRPARLDQTSAAVEVAYPHRGQPLLRGTTGDRTDPARSDLAHWRATTQQRDLPVLDDDPRLVGERSGNYAAKQAGWPIAEDW